MYCRLTCSEMQIKRSQSGWRRLPRNQCTTVEAVAVVGEVVEAVVAMVAVAMEVVVAVALTEGTIQFACIAFEYSVS